MAQGYDPNALDTRTFGDLLVALLADLNRPDLQGIVSNYARDSIRYYSRQPWLFNEIDNRPVPSWTASLYYPVGTTILETADDAKTYIFVNLVAGIAGATIPTFDHRLFATSNSPALFTAGQAGTTTDGACTWATIVAWDVTTQGPASNYWTQLTTVPRLNQYVPPVDYVAPYRIEVTAASLRFKLERRTYKFLRDLDVIRPAPITVYPTDWTFFQEQIYVWPYPNGFYPITLSYYTAPFAPQLTDESNFWTTRAERMVRKYAAGLIRAEYIHDTDSAMVDFAAAHAEELSFQRQAGEQNAGNIPASDEW